MKNLVKLGLSLALIGVLVLPALASASTMTPGLEYVGPYIGLGTQDIRVTIANIIRVAMGLLGIVAVVIILVGGFKYMTAMGNDDAIKSAKKLIFSGVIGLVLILTSYAIATFVINSIIGATTGQS